MPLYLSPALTIGQQVMRMHNEFPGFQYTREKNLPTWRGLLQPINNSTIYSIKIDYRFNNRLSKCPRVWVLDPQIHPDAKHRFIDGSLCLYYPPEGSWTPYNYISRTIVPWTAMWLVFYEIWLDTDHWYGPEAPHSGEKIAD